LVHRPILGHVTNQFAPVGDPLWAPWTSVDQQVASYGLLSHYNLILSSHLHLAQAVQIPGQPGQMNLGNGGTQLDPPTGYETPRFGPLANAPGDPVAPGLAPYPAPTMDFTDVRFGYALVRPGRNLGEWNWRHFSPDEKLLLIAISRVNLWRVRPHKAPRRRLQFGHGGRRGSSNPASGWRQYEVGCERGWQARL